MKDTPATRYRLIVGEIETRRRKINDLRYEANEIEKQMNQFEAWRGDLQGMICSHCNGAGQVNEWHDQDDCKTVTCAYCKGSGLKV